MRRPVALTVLLLAAAALLVLALPAATIAD